VNFNLYARACQVITLKPTIPQNLQTVCDLLSKNPAHPAFEKIKLRPGITIATSGLATEQILK